MTQQLHSWVFIWKKKPKTLIQKYAPQYWLALFTIAKLWKQPVSINRQMG